jgi:hypothetical protein
MGNNDSLYELTAGTSLFLTPATAIRSQVRILQAKTMFLYETRPMFFCNLLHYSPSYSFGACALCHILYTMKICFESSRCSLVGAFPISSSFIGSLKQVQLESPGSHGVLILRNCVLAAAFCCKKQPAFSQSPPCLSVTVQATLVH